MGGLRLGIAVVAALFLAAYPARAQNQNSSTNRPPVTFTDVTEQAGITFVHHNGAAGDKWYPEIFGGGVVVLDIDTDGWPDLLFVNGKDWDTDGERPPHGLYRNNQDGTFANVVNGSGFDTLDIYGLGATVADYDNDGRDDVFVTTVDGGRLFHNEGGGRLPTTRMVPLPTSSTVAGSTRSTSMGSVPRSPTMSSTMTDEMTSS